MTSGLTEEMLRDAAESYAARLSAGNAAEVAALFSLDATIEDPIGSDPEVGREAILTLYTTVIERARSRVTATGPVRAVTAASTAGR